MPITLKYKDPADHFDNGLQVLNLYHQALLETGQQLMILVDEINQQGMNEIAANQCMSLFCFYSHALFLHHQDEEQGLFPLLVDQSSLIIGMIERLMTDHQEIEENWHLFAKQLGQPENIRHIESFSHQAIAFEKLLREHLTREDKDFSPLIQNLLSEQQIKQAGEKMFQLRQAKTTSSITD